MCRQRKVDAKQSSDEHFLPVFSFVNFHLRCVYAEYPNKQCQNTSSHQQTNNFHIATTCHKDRRYKYTCDDLLSKRQANSTQTYFNPVTPKPRLLSSITHSFSPST